MKPRNNFEREVLKLHTSLKGLSQSQMSHASKTCKSRYGIYKYRNNSDNRKHLVVCSECDAHFEYIGESLERGILKIRCPHCKKKIEVVHKSSASLSHQFYYLTTDTIKGYQIFRMYIIKQRRYWRKPTEYINVGEAYQVWVNNEGKQAIIARPIAPMTFDKWLFYEPMMLKKQNRNYYYGGSKYDCSCWSAYNRYRISPELRKRGFKHLNFKDPLDVCVNVLTNSKYETLLKAGYTELLCYHSRDVEEYWLQLKLCIRHKWKTIDWSIWFDMLRILRDMGKDIHNPYYILPADLSIAHDKWHMKSLKKRDSEKLKEEMKKNSDYIKEKIKFFGIDIHSRGLHIEPLKSISDFYNEGLAMKHCVFSAKYYDKKDSLCLSCKNEKGERVETIELSLPTFNVLQSRGRNNKITEKHDTILSIIEQNKNIFKACMK